MRRCRVVGAFHNAPMNTTASLPPNVLPPIGIVEFLEPAERAELCYFGEFVNHEKGDVVVEQGLPQAFLHLVISGELRVFVKSEEAIVPLGYTQAGECVGEMSLLEPIEASATVQANAPTYVWAINRNRFDEFMAAYPAVAAKLLKAIAISLGRRLRKGAERLLNAVETTPEN
jgi:CRP/FNR family transcriptional regulator, cyclic AMP receptor protein